MIGFFRKDFLASGRYRAGPLLHVSWNYKGDQLFRLLALC